MTGVQTCALPIYDLRGGLGITLGAIQISDGTRSQVVDLSNAKTIDDVLRLIERNPPSGRKLTARITDYGLSIDIDDAGGGNLNITEVGNGTTAAELGIYNRFGTGTSPIVGQDLNPRLEPTTSVEDARAEVLRCAGELGLRGMVLGARIIAPCARGVDAGVGRHLGAAPLRLPHLAQLGRAGRPAIPGDPPP